MSNSSIWHIDRTLSGVTTPVKVDLGAMAMKEYSTFPRVGWLGFIGAVAIEKEAFGSPSTTVANFTFTYYTKV